MNHSAHPDSPRTISQLHAEMVAEDPACALTLSALRRLVRSGQVRSCRIGTKYLVTHQAVADFLAGNISSTPTPVAAAPAIRRVDL